MDDSVASIDGATTASQRRSGRVVRPPTKYMADLAAPAVKRKRTGYDENGYPIDGADLDGANDLEGFGADEDANGVDDDDDMDADDADDVDDDDEADGNHGERRRPRPKKRSNAQGASQGAAKRAAKKPKLNGSATNLPSRPKKSVRVAIAVEDNDHGSQLYGDIFASGDESQSVAARWYEKYQENNLLAVADLVNCILSAAGCDHHVTDDDINDPDNCSNRLTELQGIYEDQKITDYPLIAKSRSTRSFRELLTQFFEAFINVLHETEVLYNQPALMENVVRWVASLSSSTLRPFRHTATTVALAMLAALVEVAKKLDDRINKMTQQVETQKGRHKGKNAKDSRVATFEASLREAGKNRERVAALMKEFFDTVFVHRYRDIDPRIRTECVEALGSWVWYLPAVYMQPEYLRYLGWMLSDSNPTTRQEVLKQLARVFKRDAGKMGHFIDRFRPRLIEMATKDADISVRVTAIAVVEQLRPTGLLEPDEIDEIGKLIFDAELRIRKAVVNFFADCVREFAAVKFDEVGGEEIMLDLFGKGPSKTGQYDAPRRDWIYVKSLADTVAAYEEQLGTKRSEQTSYGLDMAAEAANSAVPETSRLALATQVLADKIPEITNWEVLAGYLLYDHSIETKGRGRNKTRTPEVGFRIAVAPGEHEEAILLEILTAAAKASLTPGSDSERLRRRVAEQSGSGADASETAALQLAGLIPQLLRKFGAEPATAVTVLRLQHSLNLEVFRQLRQDTATFEGLLDEICTQFSRHADAGVISEAAGSLLHARQYPELEEMVDGKVSALWENAVNSLRNFDKTCELSARRNLNPALATELSVTLFKISKLASITDCVDILEAEGPTADSTAPAIEILVKTVHRGKFEEEDEDLDNIEDGLTANAIGACQFYFMWKMRSIVLAVDSKTDLSNPVIDGLALLKRTFDQNLVHTFSSRGYNDDLRLYSTGAYCDLHVLFSSLRRHLSKPAVMAKYVSLGRLIDQIPPGLINELISIFDSAERTFAKKTKKTLNDPADDEDPVEDPLDDEDDDDDNDDESASLEERRAAELKAERALCDLTSHYVMAIVAKVLDHSGPQAGKLKKRLLRNQTKLGHSYKEIVTFLDANKAHEVLLSNNRKKAAAAAAVAAGGVGSGNTAAAAAQAAAVARAAAKGKEPISAPTPAAVSFLDDDQPEHHLSAPTPAAMHDYDGILIGAPTPAADLDDLDDLLESPEPEEGTMEDLRRRELLDPVIDDEEEEDDNEGGGGDDDDDDILGD